MHPISGESILSNISNAFGSISQQSMSLSGFDLCIEQLRGQDQELSGCLGVACFRLDGYRQFLGL